MRAIHYLARAGMLLGLLVLLVTVTSVMASAQGYSYQGQTGSYSPDELDLLLGPIALYPDPLIAQILPAATFPDQLVDAEDLVRNGGSGDIENQNWDISVKAIAYYPSVLSMMVDKPDWTTSIGQAYATQPDDVMASIQRLRAKAEALGYLSTNAQQRVYTDSGYIRIVPVQSQFIYVPQYDPEVVYVQRRSGSNALSFGVGFLIGAWLNRDVDWSHHRVYYHGWSGGGWVGQSRPRVEVNNTPFVNRNYRNKPVTVNRSVTNRDVGQFRSQVKHNVGTYKVPQSRQPVRTNNHAHSGGGNNSRSEENSHGR